MVALVFASASVVEQSKYVVPRTAWGDPDLQGKWPGTGMMGVPLERPVSLGDKAQLTDEELAASRAAQRQAAQDEGVRRAAVDPDG
jgi:hypothetical protein